MNRFKLIASLILCSTSLLRSDVILNEDFEVADVHYLQNWKSRSWYLTEIDRVWSEIKRDAANYFGAGTENRFLVLNDRADNDLIFVEALVKDVSDVVTVSFDFYEPVGFESGPVVIRIAAPDGGDGKNEVAVNMTIADGNLGEMGPGREILGAYTKGSKHRLVIVVNNSSKDVQYGDKRVLPSQSYDVFLDGKIANSASPFQSDSKLKPGEKLSKVVLLTYGKNTTDQTVMFDNFKIQNGATAP